MAAEPGDQELQDKELVDNEVESAEISEYEVEKLAANEEDIIDEVRLPLINKGKISADVLRSAELNANDDILSRQFQSNYTPTECVTIDEPMIPFKGRLGFKQYMTDKPTKWGIKAFTLSDATNGYAYRLQVYTGKNL